MNRCRSVSLCPLYALLALLSLLGLSPQCAHAQLGAITSIARAGNVLNLGIGPDKFVVRVCTPDMIEVHYLPGGLSTPDTPCLSAAKWKIVPAQFHVSPQDIVISTAKLHVIIQRSPCRISLYNLSNQLLVREQQAGGVSRSTLALRGAAGSHFFGIHGWEYLDHAGSQQELAPQEASYPIRAGAEGNTGGHFCGAIRGTAFMWIQSGDNVPFSRTTASSFRGCRGRMSSIT